MEHWQWSCCLELVLTLPCIILHLTSCSTLLEKFDILQEKENIIKIEKLFLGWPSYDIHSAAWGWLKIVTKRNNKVCVFEIWNKNPALLLPCTVIRKENRLLHVLGHSGVVEKKICWIIHIFMVFRKRKEF